jgi:Domain of unknown function (DUF4269)
VSEARYTPDTAAAILQHAANGERSFGAKTEPAFATALMLSGDPYLAILNLERRDDSRLSDLLARAGFVTNSAGM